MYFSPIFLFKIHIIVLFLTELYVCEAGHGAKNTYNKAISRVFYVIRIFTAGFTASPAPSVPQNHLLAGSFSTAGLTARGLLFAARGLLTDRLFFCRADECLAHHHKDHQSDQNAETYSRQEMVGCMDAVVADYTTKKRLPVTAVFSF